MTPEDRKASLILSLRRQGIRDPRVLEAMEKTPREVFVAPAFREQAWDDTALPIESGQTISQPYIVAFMTEQLDVRPGVRVLEIGTGSGYQAAVLSRLARRVHTMERHRALMEKARERFRRLNLHNIDTRVGDGARGWPEAAPFDRIIVTAAAPSVPKPLLVQLAEGGIMIIPVNETPMYQQLLRIRRTKEGFAREKLLPVRFVPLLPGVARRSRGGAP